MPELKINKLEGTAIETVQNKAQRNKSEKKNEHQ